MRLRPKALLLSSLVLFATSCTGNSHPTGPLVLKTTIEDQLTGVKYPAVVIESSNEVANSIGDMKSAKLVVRCSPQKTEVYIGTPTYNADNTAVSMRWDNGPVEEWEWSSSVSENALFTYVPNKILTRMLEHGHVIIGWQPYSQTAKAAHFDLESAKNELTEIYPSC